MATQTIEFRSPPSQIVTLRLFVVGSDTQVSSASATEATNRKGTYSAAFTDIPAGEYQYIATIGTSPIIPLASGYVRLTLTTATFQVYDAAKAVNLNEVVVDPGAIATSVWGFDLANAAASTAGAALAAVATSFTKLFNWLGAIAGKSSDPATLAEIQATAGGATFDNSTRSLQALGELADAIKAKTDLISAAGVSIVSPVRQDGTLGDLVVGDAYQEAAGRAIEITVEDVSAGLQAILNAPGATVHLGFLRYGKSRQNPDFRRYEFPGTLVSVGANTVVRFELDTDDTRGIVPSKYDYDIEFRSNFNYVTAVSNAKGRPMEWIESATELS